MNTHQLESFIQVAENLNFARASEEMNITQSAVSRQIHSLEEELNTKLFYRTTRTVSLTPEGIMFLEHAKHILGQLKIATAKIQHHTNSQIQTLSIGCESETDLNFLCKILNICRKNMAAFHPLLKIISHRSLLNLFYQGEIEIIFGFQDDLPIRKNIVFVELEKIPLCCVLPSTHPYAGKKEIEKKELYSEELILCNSCPISSKAVELQNQIAQNLPPEKIHICENLQVIFTLIRAGYGCSILPGMISRDQGICYIPVKNTLPLSFGLIYNKTSSNSILKEFINIILHKPYEEI